jgi:hypothetical protein
VDLHASLHEVAPYVTENDLVGPTLKSGESLAQFVNRVLDDVIELLRSTIPLIPGVDSSQIRVDHFAYDPDHVVLRIETDDR